MTRLARGSSARNVFANSSMKRIATENDIKANKTQGENNENRIMSQSQILSESKQKPSVDQRDENKKNSIVGYTPQFTQDEENAIFKNREVFLQHTFKSILNCKTDIKMNFKYLLARLFCRKLFYKSDQNVIMIDKAVRLIKRDLDVNIVLDHIQEIEKLKKLLLDTNQLLLFNYTLKPIVEWNQYLESKKPKNTNSRPRLRRMAAQTEEMLKQYHKVSQALEPKIQFKTVESMMKLYQAYDFLIHDKTVDQNEKKQINDKLAQLLGSQLIDIFEVSYEIPLARKTTKIFNRQNNFNVDEQMDTPGVPQEEENHQILKSSKSMNHQNLKAIGSPSNENNFRFPNNNSNSDEYCFLGRQTTRRLNNGE